MIFRKSWYPAGSTRKRGIAREAHADRTTEKNAVRTGHRHIRSAVGGAGLVRGAAHGPLCPPAGAVPRLGRRPRRLGPAGLRGHGVSAGAGGHYPRRAAGDRRRLRLRRLGGHGPVLARCRAGQRDRLCPGPPLGPRSGGGVLPGGQAGKAPFSPPYLPQAHRPVLADLHRSRYAQGPAVLLRGPDGPAVGDLAADRHSGPPALHRHLHRGRQRPGGAELPGGGHCLRSRPRCGGCGLCDLPRRLPSARTKTG